MVDVGSTTASKISRVSGAPDAPSPAVDRTHIRYSAEVEASAAANARELFLCAHSSNGQSIGLLSLCSPAGLALSPGSRAVVASYARKNGWLSRDDLYQEAALAALDAASRWRPGSGPRDLWEARLVALALSRFVAEQRVPVSLPKRKGESWKAAAGATRAPLQMPAGEDDAAVLDHPAVASVATASFVPIEDRLDLARAAAEVRRILASESEAARLVLLAEEKSAQVAARLRLPVRQVYEDTARAVRSLRAALVPLMEAG